MRQISVCMQRVLVAVLTVPVPCFSIKRQKLKKKIHELGSVLSLLFNLLFIWFLEKNGHRYLISYKLIIFSLKKPGGERPPAELILKMI